MDPLDFSFSSMYFLLKKRWEVANSQVDVCCPQCNAAIAERTLRLVSLLFNSGWKFGPKTVVNKHGATKRTEIANC